MLSIVHAGLILLKAIGDGESAAVAVEEPEPLVEEEEEEEEAPAAPAIVVPDSVCALLWITYYLSYMVLATKAICTIH